MLEDRCTATVACSTRIMTMQPRQQLTDTDVPIMRECEMKRPIVLASPACLLPTFGGMWHRSTHPQSLPAQ